MMFPPDSLHRRVIASASHWRLTLPPSFLTCQVHPSHPATHLLMSTAPDRYIRVVGGSTAKLQPVPRGRPRTQSEAISAYSAIRRHHVSVLMTSLSSICCAHKMARCNSSALT